MGGLLRQPLLVGADIGDVLVEAGQPVAMAADVGFELVAPRGEIGELRRQLGELALGLGEQRLGLGDTLVDAATHFDARLDLFLQLRVFGLQALQRDLGILVLLLLARDVGSELHQAAVELAGALLGAQLLAVE